MTQPTTTGETANAAQGVRWQTIKSNFESALANWRRSNKSYAEVLLHPDEIRAILEALKPCFDINATGTPLPSTAPQPTEGELKLEVGDLLKHAKFLIKYFDEYETDGHDGDCFRDESCSCEDALAVSKALNAISLLAGMYDSGRILQLRSNSDEDLICNCGKELDGSHDHVTCGPPVPRNLSLQTAARRYPLPWSMLESDKEYVVINSMNMRVCSVKEPELAEFIVQAANNFRVVSPSPQQEAERKEFTNDVPKIQTKPSGEIVNIGPQRATPASLAQVQAQSKQAAAQLPLTHKVEVTEYYVAQSPSPPQGEINDVPVEGTTVGKALDLYTQGIEHGAAKMYQEMEPQLAKLREESERLKPYEQAIRKAHNGYSPECRKAMPGLMEPKSPAEAMQDLFSEAEELKLSPSFQALQTKISTLEAECGRLKEALRKIEGGHFDTSEDDDDQFIVAHQRCAREALKSCGEFPAPVAEGEKP